MSGLPAVRVTPYNQPWAQPILGPGHTGITPDLCVYAERGLEAVQFRARRGGWYAIRVAFGSGPIWAHEGYLPPRAILSIRADSPPPTLGLLRPHGDPSDYNGGGGKDIGACGTPAAVHEHDAVMQRNPIGLYDMATGALRSVGSIAVEGYYHGTRGIPWNKVTQAKDYCIPRSTDIYDDYRLPADATAIPPGGETLRQRVLDFQAYDFQHAIRGYTRALTLLHDPLVRADLRAIVRDMELAWPASRTNAILQTTPNVGHAEVGREVAWVAYAAATAEKLENRSLAWLKDVFGVGLAARMRRVYRHVAHRQTGIPQAFVEGMPASPYPYGPKPASGVPMGHGIRLGQHLELCASIVAMDALGLVRECCKLSETVLPHPGTKWWDTDTGEPLGWDGPAEDQVWPAIAVWMKHNPRAAEAAAMRHRVPTNGGSWEGPYTDWAQLYEAHTSWSDRGKNAWIIQEMG